MEVNFHPNNGKKTIFIDSPGYGFADRDKRTVNSWRLLLQNYLKETTYLRLVLSLVDSKVGLTDNDLILLAYIGKLHKKILICLTKCDKVEEQEMQKVIEQIKKVAEENPMIEKYVFLTSCNLISNHWNGNRRIAFFFVDVK